MINYIPAARCSIITRRNRFERCTCNNANALLLRFIIIVIIVYLNKRMFETDLTSWIFLQHFFNYNAIHVWISSNFISIQ